MSKSMNEALRLATTPGEAIPVDIETTAMLAAELRRMHKANQDLLDALRGIAEWTERYTTPGHPISTVSRAAIERAHGIKEQEP
jgi:hypothetical protein